MRSKMELDRSENNHSSPNAIEEKEKRDGDLMEEGDHLWGTRENVKLQREYRIQRHSKSFFTSVKNPHRFHQNLFHPAE